MGALEDAVNFHGAAHQDAAYASLLPNAIPVKVGSSLIVADLVVPLEHAALIQFLEHELLFPHLDRVLHLEVVLQVALMCAQQEDLNVDEAL